MNAVSGRAPGQSDPDDALVAAVRREVGVILADLCDEATVRAIVRAVFERTRRRLSDRDVDIEAILLGETHDLCIDRLLELLRADLSTGTRDSRAVVLILAYFDPFILRTIRRKVGRPCDVDHVANDVRWRVSRRLGSFDGERGQLLSYVRQVCQCAVIDDHRHGTDYRTVDGERVPVETDSLDRQHETVPCEDRVGRELGIVEVRVQLQRNWGLLSPGQQEAGGVFLRGMTWAEGEQLLGIPRQTLQSRFLAAIRILRQGFSDDN